MQKNLIFWCPFVGDVGTAKAVLESAKSLSVSKKYNCKIFNAYGEFDKYSSILKKNKIQEIKLIKSSIIKSLPKEGYLWSRLNYILIFLFSFFPLLFYLKKNKNDYLFIYLITSLPLLLVSIFNLNNQIILRVSGKIRFTTLRKLIFYVSKKKN